MKSLRFVPIMVIAAAAAGTARADVVSDITGKIDLIVNTVTGHAYLQMTGYSSNASMELGRYVIKSSSNSILPGNKKSMATAFDSKGLGAYTDPMMYSGAWAAYSEGIWHVDVFSESSSAIEDGLGCCCIFGGHGFSVTSIIDAGLLTYSNGYYLYDLGAIYNTSKPMDLTMYYTNGGAMYPISYGVSSIDSLGFGTSIPVFYTTAIAVPEPATLAMASLAIVGLLAQRRRKK